MNDTEKMTALSRKMAHELSNLLYLTKDDFFCSDQWQAAMDALNNFINESKDKNEQSISDS